VTSLPRAQAAEWPEHEGWRKRERPEHEGWRKREAKSFLSEGLAPHEDSQSKAG